MTAEAWGASHVSRWYHREVILIGALCALLFSIPLNNSAKSISFVLAVVLLLINKVNTVSLRYLMRETWVQFLLAFVAFAAVACLWSPASWSDEAYVIKKYLKLLSLPLLALGFSDKKTRAWGLYAFLAAMFITALVAIAKTITPLYWHNHTPGFVFRNYIMTGHMMALASYLAAYFALHKPAQRVPYAVLFLLFSYEVLFLSLGRTGYIIYFVLMGLLMLQTLDKKQLAAGSLILVFLVSAAMYLSPKVQQGLVSIEQNLQHFHHGDKNTSVGYRLQFQQFAYQLFKEKPFLGHGTGSYTYYFAKQQPVPSWGTQSREPHNQYWLIAAEYGVLGLALYVALLVALVRACWQLKTMQAIAMALLIPFLLGSLSDSLLFYSGSGYFFIVLLALCLGEAVPNKVSSQS